MAQETRPADHPGHATFGMHLHKDMDMQISFGRFTLEVTLNHLWAQISGHEVFIKWSSGLPLREFAREHINGGGAQVWGFGVHAIFNPRT